MLGCTIVVKSENALFFYSIPNYSHKTDKLSTSYGERGSHFPIKRHAFIHGELLEINWRLLKIFGHFNQNWQQSIHVFVYFMVPTKVAKPDHLGYLLLLYVSHYHLHGYIYIEIVRIKSDEHE